MRITIRQVPTSAGQTPPSVLASRGASVRKRQAPPSQVSARSRKESRLGKRTRSTAAPGRSASRPSAVAATSR